MTKAGKRLALLRSKYEPNFHPHHTEILSRLFFGKIKQRLTGIADARSSRASVHDKTDLFSHLPVNVTEDGIDIYDGLSGYFDDVVEFQGRKARMEMSLVDVPPILQIQLQVSGFT